MKVEKWEIVASSRFMADLAFLQVREDVHNRIVERLGDDPMAGFEDDPTDTSAFGKFEVAGLAVTYALDVQRLKVILLRLREAGDDRRGSADRLRALRDDGRKLMGDISRIIGIGSKL